MFFSGKTRPLVADTNAGLAVSDLKADTYRLVFWRVFERIREIVGHHLTDTLRLGQHRRFVGRIQDNRSRWPGESLIRDGFGDDCTQVTGPHSGLQYACS